MSTLLADLTELEAEHLEVVVKTPRAGQAAGLEFFTNGDTAVGIETSQFENSTGSGCTCIDLDCFSCNPGSCGCTCGTGCTGGCHR